MANISMLFGYKALIVFVVRFLRLTFIFYNFLSLFGMAIQKDFRVLLGVVPSWILWQIILISR